MDDNDEVVEVDQQNVQQNAQALAVAALFAAKKAQAMQEAMTRVSRSMMVSQLRTMCISEHAGAKVAVQLAGLPHPLIGWVEREAVDDESQAAPPASTILHTEGVPSPGESGEQAVQAALRDGAMSIAGLRYVVFISKTCPAHINDHRSGCTQCSSKLHTARARSTPLAEDAPDSIDADGSMWDAEQGKAGSLEHAMLRIVVPAHRLVIIEKGKVSYLSPTFGIDEGAGRVSVLMSSWRWYWLSTAMNTMHRRPWLYKLLKSVWPAWHESAFETASCHAKLMLGTGDLERMRKHAVLMNGVKEQAEKLEEQEGEKVLAQMVQEAEEDWGRQELRGSREQHDPSVLFDSSSPANAELDDTLKGGEKEGLQEMRQEANGKRIDVAASRPFYWRWCKMQCCRRRMIAREVCKERAHAREACISQAMRDTLPAHKKERLVEEEKLQKALGGVRGAFFHSFFGVEQKPNMVSDQSATKQAAMIFFCWVYVAVLSYYTLGQMLVMDQPATIECMTLWFTAAFSEQFFTQPATLVVTTVILPYALANWLVEPHLAAARESKRACESGQQDEAGPGALHPQMGLAATDSNLHATAGTPPRKAGIRAESIARG
jgi:hypothetical protein